MATRAPIPTCLRDNLARQLEVAWSMVLDHTFDNANLTRECVYWPGNVQKVRSSIHELHERWVSRIGEMADDDLHSRKLSKWPLQGGTFGDIVAWVNIELTKNAAEIGYVRFLYASKAQKNA